MTSFALLLSFCRGFVALTSRKIFAGSPGIGEPDKYLGEYFIITTTAGRAAPGFKKYFLEPVSAGEAENR
jgi:hypothetical protein